MSQNSNTTKPALESWMKRNLSSSGPICTLFSIKLTKMEVQKLTKYGFFSSKHFRQTNRSSWNSWASGSSSWSIWTHKRRYYEGFSFIKAKSFSFRIIFRKLTFSTKTRTTTTTAKSPSSSSSSACPNLKNFCSTKTETIIITVNWANKQRQTVNIEQWVFF